MVGLSLYLLTHKAIERSGDYTQVGSGFQDIRVIYYIYYKLRGWGNDDLYMYPYFARMQIYISIYLSKYYNYI